MNLVTLLAVVFVAFSVADAFTTVAHDQRAKQKSIDHHSLHPPHLRNSVSAEDIPFWSYSGATVVTDNYIRLTPDKQSSIGMLWNTEPLDLPAWEIVMGFRVHSKAGFGADGMALWIVDDIPKEKGGLFGHPHEFHGVGVVFDTYDNDRYRDNPAVHVLYNGVGERKEFNTQSDFRGQSSGNCYFDFRNTPRPALATARIRYQDNTLQVFLSKNSEVEEVLCTTVHGIELVKGTYFLGVSAETGGISDNHDVHFLHTYPISGFEYDHDVYQHEPFSHGAESDQKHYWRAKTPEEEEAERRAKQEEEDKKREERDRVRREAEEHNAREAERRRLLALEKELQEMRKKASEQEAALHHIKEQAHHEQAQAPVHEVEEVQEHQAPEDDVQGATSEDVAEAAPLEQSAEEASQAPQAAPVEQPAVERARHTKPKQQPLKRPIGRGPLPPHRKAP